MTAPKLSPSQEETLLEVQRGVVLIEHWPLNMGKPPYWSLGGKVIRKTIAKALCRAKLVEHTGPALATRKQFILTAAGKQWRKP